MMPAPRRTQVPVVPTRLPSCRAPSRSPWRGATSWAAALLIVLLVPAPARAQTLQDAAEVAYGSVLGAAILGKTLYIGGNFGRVGPATGYAVPLDLTTERPYGNWPRANGQVEAVLADGSGGWYIGGLFTHVGGQPRRGLAHIKADLTLDSWDPA